MTQLNTSIYIREELRPAVVEYKRPVLDEDGYQTCMEIVGVQAFVHTARLAPQGKFVVEFEDGTCEVVDPQSVRFTDTIEGDDEYAGA